MTVPGDTRIPSGLALCAAHPCDADADIEVFHNPSDEAVWVPLCTYHHDRGPIDGLEYIVEVHGFVYPIGVTA